MSDEKSEYGVLIGRFQPIQNGHFELIRDALSKVKKLIIVIGSARCARNIKNPWTAAEREDMVTHCFPQEYNDNRIEFLRISDYLYNDNLWITDLQEKLLDLIGTPPKEDVLLFGHDKDASTYYLKFFPQWTRVDSRFCGGLDATTVRSMYFKCDLLDLKKHVPLPVGEFLERSMMAGATTLQQSFAELKQEYEFIQQYHDMWNGAPYPVTFTTVDAVVIKSGHVLVVKRGGHPGKGLVALPGGFLGQGERLEQAALRELKEETRITCPAITLEKSIVATKVFDHPNRSLRGRTITHAYCLDLGHGELPKVKGSDDAVKAWWMPLRDVMSSEERFYEDHFHIISYFVNKF